MRHQNSGRKLSRRRDHRTAMLANLAASLILNGRVKTTDAKAKEIRPFVERMVTFAKRGDLHARRIVLARIKDAEAVKKLFDEISPTLKDRFGGYTRIIKLGFRRGDNAPVSLIEFVTSEEIKKVPKKRKPAKAGVEAAPDRQAEPEAMEAGQEESDEVTEVSPGQTASGADETGQDAAETPLPERDEKPETAEEESQEKE